MRFSKKSNPQEADDLPINEVTYGSNSYEPPPTQLVKKSPPPTSTIGRKIQLKGELSGDEDILIEGALEGNITLSGHTVSVGVDGKVASNIKAGSIVAEGCITGDVEAEDIITVKSGSNIHGNLKSNRIQLDEGAKFWGGIDMSSSESRQNPTP